MEAPGNGFLLIPFFTEIIFRFSEARIEGKIRQKWSVQSIFEFFGLFSFIFLNLALSLK